MKMDFFLPQGKDSLYMPPVFKIINHKATPPVFRNRLVATADQFKTIINTKCNFSPNNVGVSFNQKSCILIFAII